jgi:hypothetical protein
MCASGVILLFTEAIQQDECKLDKIWLHVRNDKKGGKEAKGTKASRPKSYIFFIEKSTINDNKKNTNPKGIEWNTKGRPMSEAKTTSKNKREEKNICPNTRQATQEK